MALDTIKSIHPGKTTSQELTAGDLNSRTINDYYNRLMNIATTVFKWDNLPDSCNERFLELTLFRMGRALFFKDPERGYMNLPCTPSAELNVYHEPIQYQAYSIGYNHMYDLDDCVLIRNNNNMVPTSEAISLFAYRLYSAERAIDVNIRTQKYPLVLICPENKRLSMKNLFMKYDGNEPFIFGYDGMQIDEIKAIKTDVPYVADKLGDYKKTIMSEALNYLGITTSTYEKKERLIASEMDVLEKQTDATLQAMLTCRERACEQINKMYGLNISVSRRYIEPEELEVEDDEPIYINN